MTGVVVAVIHIGSNYVYTTKSNEAGIYTIGQLREGVSQIMHTISVRGAGIPG
jgi:hypothetical protein